MKSMTLISDLSGTPITREGYQLRVVGPDLNAVLDVTETEAVEYAQKGRVTKRRGRKPNSQTALTPTDG